MISKFLTNGKTKCDSNFIRQIQELLMKIEETVRLFLSRILNTPATVLPSFVDRFIELHGIITTNANDSLMVPDPLEEKESQGTFSLQRGSIDIGRG